TFESDADDFGLAETPIPEVEMDFNLDVTQAAEVEAEAATTAEATMGTVGEYGDASEEIVGEMEADEFEFEAPTDVGATIETEVAVDSGPAAEPDDSMEEAVPVPSGGGSIPGLLDTIDVNDEDFDEDILDV